MAVADAIKEALYLRSFLEELGIQEFADIVVYNDKQGAGKLAKGQVQHSRTKHIDIRYHFVRDTLDNNLIKLKYMSTGNMIADILTKGLPGPKH